jgi:hypothetical protein
MTMRPFVDVWRFMRMAALTGVLFSPIAVMALGYSFLHGLHRNLELEVVARSETLTRMQNSINAGDKSGESQHSTLVTSTTGTFLAGTQDPVIVADLQNRVRGLALANDVDLNSSNLLPARTVDNVSYVGLRVIVRGQLRDIQRVLHTIETSSPLLFVERLVLRIDTWPIKSADPNNDGAAALVAEVDIFGAKLPDLGSSTNASAAAKLAAPSITTATGLAPRPLAVPMESTRGGRRS